MAARSRARQVTTTSRKLRKNPTRPATTRLSGWNGRCAWSRWSISDGRRSASLHSRAGSCCWARDRWTRLRRAMRFGELALLRSGLPSEAISLGSSLEAAVFAAVGAGDFRARLIFALSGLLLVAASCAMRRRLGRAGAIDLCGVARASRRPWPIFRARPTASYPRWPSPCSRWRCFSRSWTSRDGWSQPDWARR